MQVEEEVGRLSVRAETYSLTFAADRPFVYLDDATGSRMADLFVLSSIHPLHDRDDTISVGRWRREETPSEIVFSLEVASSVWQAKTYRFRCRPRRFLYEIESGVLDMIRLNDINVGKDVSRAMTLRAAIASITCPDALIDTDNWPIRDKAAWRAYTSLQPELGVPSLYYASHIDSTGESLEEEDYALVRDMWAEYRANLA